MASFLVRHAVGVCGLGIALLLASHAPAQAILVRADLTLTWLTPPAPIGSSSFTGDLGFQTGFFTSDSFISLGTFGTRTIPGNPIVPGNPVVVAIPGNPIVPGNAIAWQLGGQTTNDAAAAFPTFAFPPNALLPSSPPAQAPLITLALNLQPGFAPMQISGSIYAFDDWVLIGGWEITLTEVPEPAAIMLFGAGLLALAKVRRAGVQVARK